MPIIRTLLALLIAGVFALAPAARASERTVTPLDAGWRFSMAGEADAAIRAVRLPHTWNGRDGEDGGEYVRGVGVYRTTFQASPASDRRLWLEIDGAALVTDVAVNGVAIGRHAGGYGRFRFDLTGAIRAGENALEVRVDNGAGLGIAPLGGDFTIFGGLYRPVRLIETDSLHLDMADHGAPGLGLETRSADDTQALITLSARVANDGGAPIHARVRFRLADADGRVVAERTTRLARIVSNGAIDLSQAVDLDRPRLWRGRADPHLYVLTAEVLDETGAVRDLERLTTGVRTVKVDAQRGFLLNGVPYPLHGANYFHAGRPGRGLAVVDAEVDEDMAMLADLGATGLRFVHFQHPQRAYDMADRLGLVVWTEVPLNAVVEPGAAFSDNLAGQMRELIRQNRHHPSVAVWGLGNEVYAVDDPADAAIARMQAVTHAEDPSRPTAYAHCCQDDLDRKALHADLTAYNRYFGWYDDTFARIGAWADERRARDPDRPVAVGEYGAGASVLQQQRPPERPTPAGDWHPEQYQADFHEAYWRALRERPWLWGTFVWVAFDLASDGRSEGDRPGINDKGLATYDRAVRKDAWYWYQANWSDRPMAHLRDRRLTDHPAGPAMVRAYSNLGTLSLSVNGRPMGEAEVRDHVATWPAVELSPGLNRIELTGDGVTDSMIWTGR